MFIVYVVQLVHIVCLEKAWHWLYMLFTYMCGITQYYAAIVFTQCKKEWKPMTA